MNFDPPLAEGRLLRRYKRFLADVELPGGEQVTIHCPNTGSMKACLAEGSPCWFSVSDNPKRKYSRTWEIATTPTGDLAGVNTGRANALVEEAIVNGTIAELQGYERVRREVPYGAERSRIDLLLEGAAGNCYVEVKNVTLCEDEGQGLFPDSVSSRGTKHLRELAAMVAEGHRAVLLFCAQHTGIRRVSAAAEIDPLYAQTLAEVAAQGVEVYAYQASIAPDAIALRTPLPVII
ncbi:DNA/RNA nuclease SfsA [Pseudomaricurvus sp. HS19]|uniref:DNA/RNA nuclease SfsA n=1 Tax=Pseudomaricurvus sp. HS19 TaxID=2692626 RepID=UPI00136A2D9C|nr:DNA/RNA nuclease SfsA [Pseudomaricurvus sp. HS19]MYM64326.1 DNA/RNA nuclease SfsA [Pseudomaricurvus sp. HS19]